jgi:hypothetical protein
MIRRERPADLRAVSMDGTIDRLLRGDRAGWPPRPDLTRRIMGRLGYMRADQAAARRARRRRWLNRASGAAVMALTLLVAVHVHNQGAAARRPAGPTIPTAVRDELRQQKERLDSLFQWLDRLWLPESARPAPDEAPPHGDDALPPPPRLGPQLDPFQWV